MSTWLVGTGNMAKEYLSVLRALGQKFKVIGRSQESADKFEKETGQSVYLGGLAKAISTFSPPELAIVAVGVENLSSVTLDLIAAGTRRILVEKPGGMTSAEINQIQNASAVSNAKVMVAYNRRQYESVRVAKDIIANDEGATSCHFDFTEWSHAIKAVGKSPDVLENWFLANSTHVVDLAFYLCGVPTDWKAWSGGSLNWHPSSSRFCGAGLTDRGVYFDYHADWEAPGRWGLEVMTRKHKLILRPFETLQVMQIGSVIQETFPIDDSLDKQFKPGLYLQTRAFIEGNYSELCSIDEQATNCLAYNKIAGYGLHRA